MSNSLCDLALQTCFSLQGSTVQEEVVVYKARVGQVRRGSFMEAREERQNTMDVSNKSICFFFNNSGNSMYRDQIGCYANDLNSIDNNQP